MITLLGLYHKLKSSFNAEKSMKPLFLGNGQNKLFGVYHSAISACSQSRHILLCSSLGHEYMRSYYLVRQIAEKLSNNGHHVFRFDWYGCGDSSGHIHDCSTEIWLHNIQLAIDEFLKLSHGKKVSIVGLRIASPILFEFVKTVKNAETIDSIVLLDPSYSGDKWLADIKTLHNSMAESLPLKKRIQSKPYEILGFVYPDSLQYDLKKIRCDPEQCTVSIPIHLIVSDDQSMKHFNTYSNISHTNIIKIASTWNLWNDSRTVDRVIMNHPGVVPLCDCYKGHIV